MSSQPWARSDRTADIDFPNQGGRVLLLAALVFALVVEDLVHDLAGDVSSDETTATTTPIPGPRCS